jgi:hypothetical protein
MQRQIFVIKFNWRFRCFFILRRWEMAVFFNPSNQAQRAVQWGRERGYWFREVPKPFVGEVLEKPLYREQWWYAPWEGEKLPQRSLARLEALSRAGIGVRQVVIAHEAPALLPSGVPPKPLIHLRRQDVEKWALIAGGALGAVGLGAIGMVVMLAAASVVVALAMPLGLAFAFADPAVLAVLEDGSVVEVDSWPELLPLSR